jgi:hypothetical protein
MPSVFSQNLRIYNAEQFVLSVSELAPTSIYLTIGKTAPWANDALPDQATTSANSVIDVWKNMIGAKLITGYDVRHAVARHDWTNNTVYSMYDHEVDSLSLFDVNNKFFVLTDDWNVYKCLSNNRGAISTVKPTQTITDSTIQEIDGYIWKYMYTVSHEERLRFTTNKYIPVRTLAVDNNSLQWQVQKNSIDGGIEAIEVINRGTNYSNTNNLVINIVGDGRNAQAIATINVTSNIIDQIIVSNPGVNYTYATVTASGGGGSGAMFRAMIGPPQGHGSDPLRELGGSYVILNPRLNNTEGDKIPIENDFRQIALIQDPRERATGNIATDLAYSQTYRLNMSAGSTEFVVDEYVYQGASLSSSYFSGSVASWDSANNVLRLTNTVGDPGSDVLIGVNSAAGRYASTVSPKDLLEYSGNVLYIDNTSAIQRDIDQTEDFKIVISF